MRKSLILLTLIVLSALFCAIRHDNPLDPLSPAYVPPVVVIDTAAMVVRAGDTIHADTLTVHFEGNDSRLEYRAWLDEDTAAWSTSRVLQLADLTDGLHQVTVEARFAGGDEIAAVTLAFVVAKRDTSCELTSFSFEPRNNPGLGLPVAGQFDNDCITLTVPHGVARSGLVASFTTTGVMVSVDGVTQRSDSSINDFTDTVTYTVLAASTAQRRYSVVVGSGSSPVTVDRIPPSIRLADPGLEGARISTDFVKIEAIIRDCGVVAAVRYRIAADTFAVTRHDDTLWFATVNGLAAFESTTVTIEAWDTTGNHAALDVHLVYDPTVDDNQPPVFTRVSGPVNGARVTADTGTLVYRISDQSGIDSAYVSINGAFVRAVPVSPDSVYPISYALPGYGLNRIDVHAIDASTARNQGVETLTLNYNTRLSGFDMLEPQDSAGGLDYIPGILLKWNKPVDADGDSIRYEISYSDSTMIFQTISTKEDSMRLTDLVGGRAYYYFILAITAFDTSRCPAADGTLKTFSTQFHPAVITGFVDQTASINDTLTHNVVVNDRDGTREYRWDIFGDGTVIMVTAIGAVTFKAPSIPGVYRSILSFVNSKGGITKDTALLTVTDNVPQVSVSDSVVAGIGVASRVQVTASDDGRIRYYMSQTLNGAYQQFSGDTSLLLPDTALPFSVKRFIQVRDDDGHVVQDSILIIKTFLTTKHSLPYSGVMRSFPGMYMLQNGSSIIRSSDGIAWDSITPQVPLSVMLPKSICYLKGMCYLAGKDSVYRAVGDSVWVGVLRLPNNIISGGQGMGRMGFALSRLRNELLITGGWSLAGSTTYQVDTAFVTGMAYGINGFYRTLPVEHPVGGYDFPVCEDGDTTFCLEGSASDPQQYLTALVFDVGPTMGAMAIKYRNPLMEKLQRNSFTAIFAEKGTVYIADKTGIFFTRDRGIHWTSLIASQLTNDVSHDGIRWIGRYKGKLAYQVSKNLQEILIVEGTEE